MNIRVACSGFPVGKALYTTKLRAVELSQLFDAKPRRSTVEKWRKTHADEFEFIVCASKVISHPVKAFQNHNYLRPHKIGGFQESTEVRHALESTIDTAKILKARLIFFRLPAHYSPHPDNVMRLQSFLGPLQKGAIKLVWEAPESWPLTLIHSFSHRQDLITAYNPLNEKYREYDPPIRYFRLGKEGRTEGMASLTDSELRRVKTRCEKGYSYVIFNNGPTAFDDAVRFTQLTGTEPLFALK